MFKRRAAVVLTAAALALAGMAGSALADDGPVEVRDDALVRVHGEPDFPAGPLTCWLTDGKVVKFSKARVAELVDEEYIEPARPVTVGGVTTVPADRLSISVPARELPRTVKVGKRWHRSRVIHLTCVWNDHASR
ncbi:hypothetical protein ACIBQ1_05845 [Nonomuraea sp. NPDC050153]|uniref:hypothetical protein n=1 Tax=Nonomuraea sp. NPDC050153 TaxID=3364359 RepID=UPI0037AD839F